MKVIPIGFLSLTDSPEESNIGKKKLKIWKSQFKIALTNSRREENRYEKKTYSRRNEIYNLSCRKKRLRIH